MSVKFTLKRLDFTFFCLFLLAVPFSVTISQAFAVLSILCYLVFRYPKFKDFPLLFWFLVSLSFCIFVTRLISGILSFQELSSILLRSEVSDFWMAFLLLPASKFTREQKSKIRFLLQVVAFFLILTGLLSFVFPYRLSSFVMDGFTYVEGKRLPHLIVSVDWLHLKLYLPIGFQNTHLTYGALLVLFSPTIFRQTFRLFLIKQNHQRFQRISFFYLLLCILILLLLLLNQSRSIWLGILLGSLVFFDLKKLVVLNRKNLLRLFAILLPCLVLAIVIYQENWLFRRSIEQLFTKQTLENQRVWIHKANFNLIKNHPYLGIGAGNYPTFFENSYNPILVEKPYLFYEISITPKSHAHHDFLHFFVLGGITCAFLYISIWFMISYRILKQGKTIGIFIGIYAVFIGGMFQCFMLDDETFLPLLGLLSIASSVKLKCQFKSISVVIIPLLFSVYSLYQLNLTDEKLLFIHRTRDSHNFLLPEAQATINGTETNIQMNQNLQYYFKLEGCLSRSKTFQSEGTLRKKPLHLTIEIPKNPAAFTFPNRYEIELRERESFDQDKYFRAHKESVLGLIRNELRIGINKIEVPIPQMENEGTLKFYDFGIRYFFENKSEHWKLPILHLNENCD